MGGGGTMLSDPSRRQGLLDEATTYGIDSAKYGNLADLSNFTSLETEVTRKRREKEMDAQKEVERMEAGSIAARSQAVARARGGGSASRGGTVNTTPLGLTSSLAAVANRKTVTGS